jgi:hypothetical protein
MNKTAILVVIVKFLFELSKQILISVAITAGSLLGFLLVGFGMDKYTNAKKARLAKKNTSIEND